MMPPPPPRELKQPPQELFRKDDDGADDDGILIISSADLNRGWQFCAPTPRIKSPEDIQRLLGSRVGKQLEQFIAALGHSVSGKSVSDIIAVAEDAQRDTKTVGEPDIVLQLVGLLDTLGSWIDEFPPAKSSSRYGNVSFRLWQQRLQDSAQRLCVDLLPDSLQGAGVELAVYLSGSFGNAVRIDYGTGHELSFICFLFCLARLGLIARKSLSVIAGVVIKRYLEVMRRLQTTYWLEPAGSHGVWGLDDYHFLPFILGASQLVNHPQLLPCSIHDEAVIEKYKDEYFYIECIAFVKKVKKGPMGEHSPMLNDISGVHSWKKVFTGMLKMYRGEVLNKVPIMQHFLFGSLIPWIDEPS